MAEKLILHIDMNSFFASCEQAKDPSLKEVPLIVGGDPKTRKGIVLAASYDAKAFGVKTTMLIHEAMRRCPTAKIIKASHGLYEEMSRQVMEIFDAYTPLKEQVSIDEAYLDMTGSEHLFGEPFQMAKKIQAHILSELNLPCSVGIAHNRLCAKMASDMKKPMGITQLFEEDVPVKLWPLAVGELHGVGKKSGEKLMNLGIRTIGELANTDPVFLSEVFGSKYGEYIYESANGRGSNVISAVHEPPKSIGNELTYSSDLKDKPILQEQLLLLSDKVGHRLRKHMVSGRTITIKLKYNDFKLVTKSRTLDGPTHHTDVIYQVSNELLSVLWNGKPVRLIGVTVSGFMDEQLGQLSLFDMETVPDHPGVDHMLDEIRERFGYQSVGRAKLLKNKPSKET